METRKPIISIIVAVYNTEQYLPRAVDSIINQSYSNLQILLIDNGCTDNCSKICDTYSMKDKRVKSIHLPTNNGIGPAWNAGVDAAIGDWIGFVDSDDWIEPDMYEYLLKNAIEYKADIAICGHYREFCDRQEKFIKNATIILDTEQAMGCLLNDIIYNCMWDKLWNRKLFNEQRFPEDGTFEDTALVHRLIGKSNRTVYLPQAKHHYFQRGESLMHIQKMEVPINIYRAYRRRYEDMYDAWPQFQRLLKIRCFEYSLPLWRDYFKYTKNERIKYRTQLAKIAKFNKDHFCCLRHSSELSIARRTAMWFTQYATWWSFLLINILDKVYSLKVTRQKN